MRYMLICNDEREEVKLGRLYKHVLITKYRKMINIQAVRISKLSGSFSSVRVCGMKNVFDRDHVVMDGHLERDGGDLDLLIGTYLAKLHMR